MCSSNGSRNPGSTGQAVKAGAEDRSVVVTMPVSSEPASGFDPAFGWGQGSMFMSR